MNVDQVLSQVNLDSHNCVLYAPLDNSIANLASTSLTMTDHSMSYAKNKTGHHHGAFGGSNYIQITESGNELSFTDGSEDLPFTMMGWFKPDLGSGTYRGICNNSSSATSEWEYVFGGNSSGLMSAYLYDDAGTNQINITYSVAEFDETWFHGVVRYDGSGSHTGLEMLINGNVVDATTATAGTYAHMSIESGSYPTIGLSGINYSPTYAHGGEAHLMAFKDIELSNNAIRKFYNATYIE